MLGGVEEKIIHGEDAHDLRAGVRWVMHVEGDLTEKDEGGRDGKKGMTLLVDCCSRNFLCLHSLHFTSFKASIKHDLFFQAIPKLSNLICDPLPLIAEGSSINIC